MYITCMYVHTLNMNMEHEVFFFLFPCVANSLPEIEGKNILDANIHIIGEPKLDYYKTSSNPFSTLTHPPRPIMTWLCNTNQSPEYQSSLYSILEYSLKAVDQVLRYVQYMYVRSEGEISNTLMDDRDPHVVMV